MYKCAKTLMYLAFFVVIPTLLSACGGASKENILSQQQSNPTDKVEVNNSSTNAEVSSSLSPASSLPSQSQSSLSQDVAQPATIQLQLYQLTETSITLIWDNVAGISYYEISRDSGVIARVDSPSYTLVDQGLKPFTEYHYTITAFDLAGKESTQSQTFTLRTLAVNGALSSIPSPSTQPDNIMPSIGAASSASPQLGGSLSSISSNASSSLSSISAKSSSSRSLSSASSKSSSSLSLSSISSKSSSSRSLSSTSSAKSSSTSSSSSSSSSSSASSIGQQAVTISWNHPSQRENGVFLELNEIGGYEIRYRKPTDTSFTYITLTGNLTTEYTFVGETKDLEFEIAVFDNRGVHSRFAKISH